MKVIFGPDHNGAFRVPRRASDFQGNTTPEALVREVWRKAYDWQAGQPGFVRELASEHAWLQTTGFQALMERIHPDVVICCHGLSRMTTYRDGHTVGLWEVTTQEGRVRVEDLLWQIAEEEGDRPLTVWVISCNPDGVVPVPPPGMTVWFRQGTSNPFSRPDLWEWRSSVR